MGWIVLACLSTVSKWPLSHAQQRSESFSIPVDIGNRIDVIYNDDGWGQYHDYSITDNYGNIVFNSNEWGLPGDNPCDVYGLNPCAEDPTCGLIEITFADDSGDGWYYGNLGVFSESGLEANIFFNPDFDGDGYADYIGFSTRTAVVTVDEGEVDFIVSDPIVYPTQCGYTVRNPEGDIIINESSTNEAPQSILNYVICENTTSNVTEAESETQSIFFYPNPIFDYVRLEGLDEGEAWELDILNSHGQMIRQQNGIGNDVIDATKLTSGIYTILLRSSTIAKLLYDQNIRLNPKSIPHPVKLHHLYWQFFYLFLLSIKHKS